MLSAGWVGGYTSSLLLSASLSGSWPVWNWPLGKGYLGLTASPIAFFGLVGLLYCLWLSFVAPRRERLMEHIAGAGIAGIFGSLVFWVAFGDQWYVGLVHGVIWGTLVGGATARSVVRFDSGGKRVI